VFHTPPPEMTGAEYRRRTGRDRRHVLQPGESLTVDIFAMDSARLLLTPATAQDARQAYSQMVDELTTAWQRPAPTASLDAERNDAPLANDGDDPASAYRAMVRRTCDAWKR
jgi:hypothetical protein